MKILHTAETIKGGISTVIKHLAQGAIRSGNEVTCFIPATQIQDLAGIPGENIVTFPDGGRGLATSLRFVGHFVSTIWTQAPDVVHLHSSFAGALGRICVFVLKPFRRCKVVYSPHAFAFSMKIPAWKRWLYSLVERMLMPLADAVICTCQYELDTAVEHGLDPRKLHLVHNGVPESQLPATLDENVPDDELQMLFVGRFDYQKGFDVLLDAMRLLENEAVHLVAIGASVHGGISAEPRPNIHYAGWVKLADLPDFYRRSHLLVMPSRWEGFAMVPLEALSNGLPVLTSDHPSFDEVVVSGTTGTRFPSEDATTLAEQIRSLHVTDLLAMRSQCVAHFKRYFRVDMMVERTEAVYRALLAEHQAVS